MATDKEIEALSIRKDLQNCEDELKIISEHRDRQIDLRDKVKRMIDLSEQMHTRALTMFENVRPVWKFEQDTEYNALKKEMTDLQHGFDILRMQADVDKLNAQLKSFDEQIQSQTTHKDELLKQLAELDTAPAE